MHENGVVLDLAGMGMEVSAVSPQWIDRMRAAFRPLARGGTGGVEPGFRLEILNTPDKAPSPHSPLTWEGIQTDGNYGRVYENETSALLQVEDGGVLSIDHAARHACAYFKPDAHSKFFGTPLMMAVEAALAANGQELVHAACLVERRSGRAILVSAPSGGGKTTTSLALAHSGFGLLTDDASVVIPGDPVAKVWGLPRRLKVHRKTAQMLEWLGSLPDVWDANDEQGLDPADFPDVIDLAKPEPVELGAVFELGPRREQGHEITRLDKSEALVGLAHENVAWRPAGMVPKAVRKFQILARAVSQVPTYRLSAGPDLASLPGQISEIMNGADIPSEPA